ncbi:hypothetical protein E2F47_09280 [Mycobacterium eburneum]|nr:hypothetical protein [Mycobacterium eburneum]TDH55899.1 hypothetical protein E2F47_09280 [Mycobacterium eburneum]
MRAILRLLGTEGRHQVPPPPPPPPPQLPPSLLQLDPPELDDEDDDVNPDDDEFCHDLYALIDEDTAESKSPKPLGVYSVAAWLPAPTTGYQAGMGGSEAVAV